MSTTPESKEVPSAIGDIKSENYISGQDVSTQHVEAKNATDREHELTVRDAMRLYKKAIIYSLIFSTAIIMEGYDVTLLPSFFGYTAFQEKFGNEPGPGGVGKVVSADWQTKIQNAGLAGQILGLIINGYASDYFGYRKTMMAAQLVMVGGIFIPFFAQNLQTLLAGNIILGLPWGIFQTLSVTYASDLAPVVLRPYLTTYINLCWVIGQILASGILKGLLSIPNEWSYRIPFALQWVWPPLLIVGTLLAPESPWWLVRKGRFEDARKALLKITSPNSGVPFNADEQLALIQATDRLEKQESEGQSYLDCFKGTSLRRTEIACVSYVAQALCGTALMGYSVQFYQRAGLSTEDAFTFSIGQFCMGFVGTVASWFLMGRWGRRPIYLWGVTGLLVCLVIVGGLGFADQSLKGPAFATGTMLLVYTLIYDLTIGPLCYSIVAEIPSTRHKIKTVVMARGLSNCMGFVNNVLMPNMLGVNAWNWGAKSGLFWAGLCSIILCWAYFRLPEPKDRTYGELDILFERGVSARKFASTHVDQFADSSDEKAMH
ncbi:general alpha-glucoside permease [Microdochium bolleyi]|uniref:General alpha-glucoside permease n=1 Tax=Microdochium bolleyi TaxID=196109 RepID=A0A136IYZ0_9PEZI|nr:general alpha-glucoside permease [Microdochium bolleyi]